MVIYTEPERANISKSLKTEFTVTIMLNGNLFHTQTPLSRHRQMKPIENVKNQNKIKPKNAPEKQIKLPIIKKEAVQSFTFTTKKYIYSINKWVPIKDQYKR